LLNNEKLLSFETLDYLWEIVPFSIRFCDFKPQNRYLSIHKDIELHFVFEGKEAYTLNEKEYLVESNGLICVNAYAPHNYYTLERSQSITVIISTNFLLRNGFDPSKIYLNEFIKDSEARALFSKIAEEFKKNGIAHSITMNALILSLVAYIAAAYSRKRTENEGLDGLKMLGSMYEYVCVAIDYINENFANTIMLDELSALCGLSKYHFLRIFKKVTGYTPSTYVNQVRTNYAMQLLLNGANVTEAATESGFSDVHYFSNCFKKYKGYRPSEIITNPTKGL